MVIETNVAIVPQHEGYITTGETMENGCQYDQQSLTDENGELVTAIKDEWIIGVLHWKSLG